MKINTDEITNVIKHEINRYSTELEVTQVGKVIEAGDGIARIYGLSNAMAGEMLEFDVSEGEGNGSGSTADNVSGQVFNLEEDTVGAVIYGDFQEIKEGMSVRATNK